MRRIQNVLHRYEVLEYMIWALLLNIIIEILSRDTLREVWNHVITYPIYFAFNLLILTCTLSFSSFFKRRKIAATVISAGWLGLGIGNHVVLSYRITPFAAIDLSIMEWDFDFLESYLSVSLVLGIVAAILVIGFALLLVVKKSKVYEVNWKKSLIITSVLLVITVGIHYSFFVSGIYEERISNMQESYDKFGFVSCFTRSATERGIDKPEQYSNELIENITKNLDATTTEPTVKPNIIVVQLESFFDPSLLVEVEFSENPIPTFTKLCEENSSGSLEVAVVGAGTANTEFEVLTSMSVDYFGTGEYPYETVLHEETCESVAYNLKELGYNTFAIHNNTGTFYERHEVYPNLGFDTFISSEFMGDTSTTPQGWIKDKYLTPQIQKCLDSTENEDFIFAVSVQGHGSFPEEGMENPIIKVTESPFDEVLEKQVEYYVNQLYEMDLFIEELVKYLSEIDEPTVLVLYGDHIPSLDIDASYYEDENNYQTTYVYWANYEMEEVNRDLATYQLLPEVLDQVDIHEGVLTRLHQQMSEEEYYYEYLKTLQYDLLYGDIYVNDGEKYEEADMNMGVGEMTFEIHSYGDSVYLISEDITSSSVVFVNDKKVESLLTDGGDLKIDALELEPGDSIVIKQISSDNTVLYESESVIL